VVKSPPIANLQTATSCITSHPQNSNEPNPKFTSHTAQMEKLEDIDPTSPLFQALKLIKENDLVDSVWLIMNMNKISLRFIELGALDTILKNTDEIHPSKVRSCMEMAINEYVSIHMDCNTPQN
jgi:hypothetical protein